MKYISCILVLFFSIPVFAQVNFNVADFSKDYYGKIFIADTSEVFSNGSVSIYEKKTNKLLIRVNSEELAINLYDGKAAANIKQLPYGEQSIIMYDDLNFDGIKDFAIEDGQNSCYHGPSFRIYLAGKTGFTFNADFTQLAQDNCGMFDVDPSTKTIRTMTKSGCCWHGSSEYIVENNKPKEIKTVEDDQSHFPFASLTEKTWNGKKMVTKITRTIDLEEVNVLLSFTVAKNNKRIILFIVNESSLNYALLNTDSTIEFSYPVEAVYQNSDFSFNQKDHTVTFKNQNAVYKIYSSTTAVGIDINVAGKKTSWEGIMSTRKDKLTDLLTTKPENVVIQ